MTLHNPASEAVNAFISSSALIHSLRGLLLHSFSLSLIIIIIITVKQDLLLPVVLSSSDDAFDVSETSGGGHIKQGEGAPSVPQSGKSGATHALP